MNKSKLKNIIGASLVAIAIAITPAKAHAFLPFVFVLHSSGKAILTGKKGYVKRTLLPKPISRFLLSK